MIFYKNQAEETEAQLGLLRRYVFIVFDQRMNAELYVALSIFFSQGLWCKRLVILSYKE